jgi:hypothetical protein
MTLRFRRRADDWSSAHERAHVLAAERIEQPLAPADDAWLIDHLAGCPECAAIASAYAAQRAELRGLRRHAPVPPRDLWARTAAAIEHEAAAGAHGRNRERRRTYPSPIPLGAISGVLVIAVVVAASLMSRPVSRPSIVAPTPVSASVGPTGAPVIRPTPFSVAAANVGWLKLGADGKIEVYDTPVARVCPAGEGADCPPIDEPTPRSIQLGQAPASVTRSPKDSGLVVVDSDTKGNGGGVYVLPGSTGASARPSSTPVETPAIASATPVTTPPPSTEPTPSGSAAATESPGIDTTGSEPPSIAPSATPVATEVASPSPSVRVTASPTTGTIEIASDVIVVGESEAYSPDGAWFAFSARPSNGSQGPDIYLWRPGDAKATAITSDHRSMFSGWLGARILGSRGEATGDPRTLVPHAFLIDAATRLETALAARIWRPSVDPLHRVAVYWDGALELDPSGTELRPADGHLVLGGWTGALAPAATTAPSTSPSESAAPSSEAAASPSAAESPAGDASATPGATAVAPSATPEATTSPSPTSAPAIEPVELATGAVRDWDARWDETGTHLAVWIATEGDPRIGDLTLYSVDPASGKVVTLKRVAALAGFSIGKGRLAWATPRGQDGQGNRVQVVAWTKDSVGSVESRESTEALVVIR